MLWSVSVCLLAMVLTTFILNTVLGLLVFYFDQSQSVFWHVLSPYTIALLLLVMGWSVLYEFYVFRSGGHTLAKQLKACFRLGGARRLPLFAKESQHLR